MKIVILDGYTLNPGDISWDKFKVLGELVVYERTNDNNILERAKEADAILINKVNLTKDVLNKLPGLKYIGVLATGYNVVDINEAIERDITVTNIPAYGTESVAQMVFALLLELTQNAGIHSASVKEGEWSRSEDWCYWKKPLIELKGLTFGIIGLGRIGKAAAEIAHAFSMNVIANDNYIPASVPEWIEMVNIDRIFSESNVVSLHCPLTGNNRKFVNSSKINLMKKSAFLINTSRGLLVNENDLVDALNNNRIAGAGLDVLSKEPPDDDNPLLSAKNCIITPHIAWATKSARLRLMDIAFENLNQFVKGNPVNVITS